MRISTSIHWSLQEIMSFLLQMPARLGSFLTGVKQRLPAPLAYEYWMQAHSGKTGPKGLLMAGLGMRPQIQILPGVPKDSRAYLVNIDTKSTQGNAMMTFVSIFLKVRFNP